MSNRQEQAFIEDEEELKNADRNWDEEPMDVEQQVEFKMPDRPPPRQEVAPMETEEDAARRRTVEWKRKVSQMREESLLKDLETKASRAKVLAAKKAAQEKKRQAKYNPDEPEFRPNFKKPGSDRPPLPAPEEEEKAEAPVREITKRKRPEAEIVKAVSDAAREVKDDASANAAAEIIQRVLGGFDKTDVAVPTAIESTIAKDLLASLYALANAQGASVPMSLIPSVSRTQRRIDKSFRFVEGSERTREQLQSAFSNLVDALSARASAEPIRAGSVVPALNADLKIKAASFQTVTATILKNSRSSCYWANALQVFKKRFPGDRYKKEDVHMFQTMPFSDQGFWPFRIDLSALKRDPTRMQYFAKTAGVDKGFADALSNVARSYANMAARGQAVGATELIANAIPFMAETANQYALSTGSRETMVQRFNKGSIVGCLSASMRTFEFEYHEGSMAAAFHATCQRMNSSDRLNGAEVRVMRPDPASASRCDASGFWKSFLSQFEEPLLPGFGIAIFSDGPKLTRADNVVHWMDCVELGMEGVTSPLAKDYPDVINSALIWANRDAEAMVAILKRMKAMARPKTWKFNLNSSAGPLFERKPNSQARKAVRAFWRDAMAKYIKGRTVSIEPEFLRCAIRNFDAKMKDEILPYASGHVSKSRLVYSGTLDLLEAVFLGLFQKKLNFIESGSLAGFNPGTSNGIARLFHSIARYLEDHEHLALTFRDNLYIAIRMPDRSERAEKAYRAIEDALFDSGAIEVRGLGRDFQWVSLDITSMEACQPAKLANLFWATLFDHYDKYWVEQGMLGMSKAVRRFMEECIQSRDVGLVTIGETIAISDFLFSGLPDTGERNQALGHHAGFLINSLIGLRQCEIKGATYPNGKPAPFFHDHLTNTKGTKGTVSIAGEIIAACEAFGMLAKVESVVGGGGVGVLELLSENTNAYLPIDLLGYGVTGTRGQSGNLYLTPVLAPERMWPSLAYSKTTGTNATAGVRMALSRVTKGVSLMLSGGWKDFLSRQVMIQMMVAACGILGASSYDMNDVLEGVTSVLEQNDLVDDPTLASQIVANVLRSQRFGLNWVIEIVHGQFAVQDLAHEYGALYVTNPIETFVAPEVPEYLLARHSDFYVEIAVKPADRQRYAPGLPTPAVADSKSADVKAVQAARSVMQDEHLRRNLVVPADWVMPTPKAGATKPQNYRPLAWALIYSRLPDATKAGFDHRAWYKALHSLERDYRVSYSFEPSSLAALEARSPPENLPRKRSKEGFLAHPKPKKAAEKAQDAAGGGQGLITEEQWYALNPEDDADQLEDDYYD